MSQKKNILSFDNITTIAQGAIAGVTFGVYHQYISNKMMEINNKKLDKQMEEFKAQHKKDMDELRQLYDKIKEHKNKPL